MRTLDLTKHIPLNRSCLIEASAGTGKTFSITNIFLHAVLSDIPVEQILVVTFTEAATKELRTRIRENMTQALSYLKDNSSDNLAFQAIIFELFSNVPREKKQNLLETALLNIDQASIFTIHSFCQRMLTENSFESKIAYGAELLTDSSEIIQELAENFWRENLLNVSADDKELYGDIKFDEILDLAKELVRYHNVEKVNDKLELPPALDVVKTKYSDLLAAVQPRLESFVARDVKAEITKFFAERANDCKAAYKNEQLEKKVDNVIKSIQALKDVRPLKHFTYESLTAKAFKKGIDIPPHDFFELCTSLIPVIEAGKKIEDVMAENREYIKLGLYNNLDDYIKTQFAVIKEERNILTFDDLLVRLYEALNDETRAPNRPLTNLIRDKFRLALVDEFQDTDDIQYEIFNILFGENDGRHGFFMIGDPKQSIYKFRGADIFSYLTAKKSAHESFTLDTNYRSEVKMVAAVNELFAIKQDDTFAFAPVDGKPGITYEKVNSGSEKAELIVENGNNKPLQFWLVDGFNDKFAERNIADNIADEIIRLIDVDKASFGADKLLTPGDVAILVNTNKQAAMVKGILTKSKIPAVIQNSVKVFESWEARELQLWLKAVINPMERHIRPLLVTNLLRQPMAQIDNFPDNKIIELTEELTLLNKLWQKNGFFSLFLQFINNHQVQQKALGQMNGERIITNYVHLAELLHKHELKNGRSIDKTLSYLEHQIKGSGNDDEYMQRLESDSEAVKIMTIHKAKGLEFPVVFCPFLWSNAIGKGESKQKIFLFTEEDNGRYIQKLDFGADKETNRPLVRHETVAEHIRLMYVAVTRAANRCYLPIANVPSIGKSIIGYLFTDEILHDDTGGGILSKIFGTGSSNNIRNIQVKSIAGIKQFVNALSYASLEEKMGINSPSQLRPVKTAEQIELQPRLFAGKNLYKWGVGSFSSLIKDQPYHSEKTESGSGIFSLPKGKNFGLAVHTIFQNYFTLGKIEFYADLGKNLEAPLKVESYFRSANDEKRQERFAIAQQMITNVLEQPINVAGDSLRLGDIISDHAKPELDFFYKINKISPILLKEIFASHGLDEIKGFQKTLENLNFSLRKGYMNGEIDLLFRDNGKYYVLDWKTNHLGPQSTDYSAIVLRENMAEHYYILQYHIYTLAVHLFLQQQLQGYNYDKDFGGVLYVYTRGVDGQGNGLFFDKPPQALIEALEKELVKNG